MSNGSPRDRIDLRDQTGRHAPSPDQSLGDLIGTLTEDMSRLLRQEVALARAETKREVTAAGRGLGMLGAAGAVVLVGLIMLSIAGAQTLTEWVDSRLAYLIVAVVWFVLGGILLAVGRGQLREVSPVAERTKETLREIPQMLRGR